MTNAQSQEFLTNLATRAINLDICIKFCEENKNTENVEINVISTSLLYIFGDMKQYLENYKSVLEKKYLLELDHIQEWEKMKEEILVVFFESLKNDSNTETTGKRLVLIGNFVSHWVSFPKEGEITNMDSSAYSRDNTR